MNRGRLIAVVAGAAVLTGAIVVLRGGVQPPASPVVGPDGERITAYHDPALVDPPQRTGGPPQQPGRLHTDARRGGALVSWPPAPYGFEVRWGRSGESQDPRNVRYVASSSTSLHNLSPGRYRIEVRSVDELGRRSEPSSADVEVSDRTPQWQQGLGFVEDFTAGAGLGPDRWRLTDFVRRCTRREGDPGPILLDGTCGPSLRPISPLVLSDPDADGVRGRVVVLADSPPPPATPVAPPPRPPEAEPLPPDSYFTTNNLVIGLSPAPSPLPMQMPFASVQLRIGSHGAFLGIQRSTGAGQHFEPPDEHRLDAPRPGSPGALQRWELVFTADHVQVHLDGQQIGSVEYRPSWQRAEVTLFPMIVSDDPAPGGPRIGLVGLTGPAPDGRATELIELTRGANSPEAVQRFPIAAAPSAVSAQLHGLIIGSDEGNQTGELPPPPPPVTIEVGGRRLELHQPSNAEPYGSSDWFVADVPADVLGSNTAVTVRSENGADFTAAIMELEIVHRPGVRLETPQPVVVQPGRLAAATPRLVVRHGQQVLDSGRPVPRDRLEVEVQLDGMSAQGAAGHLAGYVALRVELDGRRILDFPTATDGPAVTGTYRFTLDVTELPAGSYQNLVVRLIPDRADASNRSEPFVVRMARS